jgi:CheY-like chemotaxis protein
MVETTHHNILVVEDSPEDFELTVRAFERAGFKNPLYRCADGDEALDFLHRRGAYKDPVSAPRPGVILLDLNLPGTDGRDVLHQLKTDHELKKIPIIILTTSKDDRDVQHCYDCGANSYVHKPVTLDGFYSAIQRLSDFWLDLALLPDRK